jgi:hypothetical protein
MKTKDKYKFLATNQQEKAFKRAINAIKKCHKLGLVIYAKQYDLVAYTKFADDYIEKHGFLNLLQNGNSKVECISIQCLSDSGADDYPSYLTNDDNPENITDEEEEEYLNQ